MRGATQTTQTILNSVVASMSSYHSKPYTIVFHTLEKWTIFVVDAYMRCRKPKTFQFCVYYLQNSQFMSFSTYL